jgi:PPM family protein phosphatase
MALAAYGVTHTGRRKTNEDTFLVDLRLGLFVVADGMGGHNAGEVASAIAVRTVHDFIAGATPRTERVLSEGLCLANDQVLNAAVEQPNYAGMGTTVVAACVIGDQVLFGSVGDSRIYLYRDGRLTQLTRDDSWVSRVLGDDALSADDVQRHPMRHVLTKVVGLREDLEPSMGARPFSAGDMLLLCSDGLHGSVGDELIAETLAREATARAAAETLVRLALDAGASDNVTVIVVRQE